MINYLLDPFIQIENSNGQPVVGAKIYVYYTGSRTLAPIYSNKSGTSLANPAITDTLGNVTIFAKTGSFYDVLVYDNDGTLLFSKINVTPSDSTAADVREVDIVAGFGIQVHKRYQGNKAIYNVAIDPDEAATQADVAAKQDKLTPGANIEITNDNTINVVNRKTLYTQWPIKMDRSTSMLKLYLDDSFSNDFKTKQETVSYGGNDKYISEITQNENGEINATVKTMSDVPTYTAGNGISIENNVISCSGDITPYTAGNGITINNHEISISNISIDSIDFDILNVDHTLTNDDITNKGFSITIPGNIDYWDWCANALITSAPIATISIGTYYSEGRGEVIYSCITNIFEGGSQNSFAVNEQTLYGTGITYLRTWPSSKPLGLDHQKLEIGWTGNLLSVGDRFTCSIIIQPSKLVIS